MRHLLFHKTMAGVSCFILILSAITLPLTQINLDWMGLLPKGSILVALLLAGLYYRRRQEDRLEDTLLFSFWFVLLSNLYLLPMYAAARRDVPLSDAMLSRIDQAMGVYVPSISLWVKQQPWLNSVSAFIYFSLLFTMLLAIMVPPLAGRPRYTKEFAVGTLCSAAIGIPLLSVIQAMGPWHYHGLSPDVFQLQFSRTFSELHREGWYTLTFRDAPGLMTFPSFHVILAILSGMALRGFSSLKYPSYVIAALICLTTLTTAWHYLTDVLGGLLIATLSALAAQRFTAYEEAASPRP